MSLNFAFAVGLYSYFDCIFDKEIVRKIWDYFGG